MGREGDVAQTADWILAGRESLVTLTGVGGSGKTRLALQVASEVLASFPGGGAYVELARVREPSQVPEAVAAALGVSEAHGSQYIEAITMTLRPHRVLLVLDNCEHVIDACARLVDHLLAACPDLCVLATSREPLQIAGERQRRVPPLPAPRSDIVAASHHLLDFPAVRLFVERAQAVSADFELSEENAQGVAAICELLGGLPLALELAAARIGLLSVAQIHQRLDDCFKILVSPNRSAPSRQQTLRAALDWSHDLLSDQERTVFRRLSVFPAGWSIEGAEAVCAGAGVDDTDVLDLMSRLVDKSLVLVEEQSGESSFRFLEPVRQYAERRLEEHAEAEETRGRLIEYHIDLSERAEARMHGPGQAAWMQRLDRELDNVRGLFHRCMEHDDVESAMRIVAPLYWYSWMRHHLREAQHWYEATIARGAPVDPAVRAKTLMACAMTCSFLGDPDKGRLYGEEALAYFSDAGVLQDVVWTEVTLGYLSIGQGDVALARERAERGLAAARDSESRWHLMQAHMLMAQVLRAQGDGDGARSELHEALSVLEDLGDRWSIISITLALADVDRPHVDLWRQGAVAAVRLYWEQGDQPALAGALEYLARREAGDLKARVRLLSAAHAVREGHGVPLLVGERQDVGSMLAGARSHLGEAAYEKAWTAGQSTSLEDLVRSVIGDAAESLGGGATPSGEEPSTPGGLTRREWEVAALLAQGCTDRQIAEGLFIARGTASLHVHHILEKLELRSRVQVADWWREHGSGAP